MFVAGYEMMNKFALNYEGILSTIQSILCIVMVAAMFSKASGSWTKIAQCLLAIVVVFRVCCDPDGTTGIDLVLAVVSGLAVFIYAMGTLMPKPEDIEQSN